MTGRVDLCEVERILALPPIPVWPEANIDGNALVSGGGTAVLAAFHPPTCRCGRPYGIAYDQKAIALDRRYSMNEVLLHEAVHAWQYWLDPEGAPAKWERDDAMFGHEDAPHEVEARVLARRLDEIGVQVWFPALG